MARFRKKPIVIEAVQLTWANWEAVCDLAGVGKLIDGRPEGCYVNAEGKGQETPVGGEIERIGLHIPTKVGLMLGAEGDWIIKGIAGEIYPCKPDIFAATYDPLTKSQGDGE